MLATTSIKPRLSMKPSFSYSSNISYSRINAKLSSTIDSATVISFEKRTDQKIWYIIKVVLQNQLFSTNRSYVIARKFEDFIQLSQHLYNRFSSSKYRIKYQLPPKIKNRLNMLPLNKHHQSQRLDELNRFLFILFQNQSLITESHSVLDFFKIQSSDLDFEHYNDETGQQTPYDMQPVFDRSTTTSKWKKLRCSSFLTRSPPPQPTTSVSTLCNQTVEKTILSWSRHDHDMLSVMPSASTPVHPKTIEKKFFQPQEQNSNRNKETINKRETPFMVSHPLIETPDRVTTRNTRSSQDSTYIVHYRQQLKDTIKLKIIYDVDNIIVIQVPRSITLEELRSRVRQKFSDICEIENEIVLLYSDSISSCCSTDSVEDIILPVILINKERDLSKVMHTKWNRLEKVTLRCIM